MLTVASNHACEKRKNQYFERQSEVAFNDLLCHELVLVLVFGYCFVFWVIHSSMFMSDCVRFHCVQKE